MTTRQAIGTPAEGIPGPSMGKTQPDFNAPPAAGGGAGMGTGATPMSTKPRQMPGGGPGIPPAAGQDGMVPGGTDPGAQDASADAPAEAPPTDGGGGKVAGLSRIEARIWTITDEILTHNPGISLPTAEAIARRAASLVTQAEMMNNLPGPGDGLGESHQRDGHDFSGSGERSPQGSDPQGDDSPGEGEGPAAGEAAGAGEAGEAAGGAGMLGEVAEAAPLLAMV